jgi:hypothetical protein
VVDHQHEKVVVGIDPGQPGTPGWPVLEQQRVLCQGAHPGFRPRSEFLPAARRAGARGIELGLQDDRLQPVIDDLHGPVAADLDPAAQPFVPSGQRSERRNQHVGPQRPAQSQHDGFCVRGGLGVELLEHEEPLLVRRQGSGGAPARAEDLRQPLPAVGGRVGRGFGHDGTVVETHSSPIRESRFWTW